MLVKSDLVGVPALGQQRPLVMTVGGELGAGAYSNDMSTRHEDLALALGGGYSVFSVKTEALSNRSIAADLGMMCCTERRSLRAGMSDRNFAMYERGRHWMLNND